MITDNSYRGAFAVTKSDSTILEGVRGLYVGGAGAVAVVLRDRVTSVIFSAVPVGTILPIEVTQVLSTGTDATLILALV